MQLQKSKKYSFVNNKQIPNIEAVVKDCGEQIMICENPICYPLANAAAGYDFEGGLIDGKTLQLVEEAVLIRHNKLSQVMPECNYKNIEIDKLPKITGTFFFGGVLFNNFGHFLLESVGRLWAYESIKQSDPYIFFYAPWGIPDYKKKDNYVHQVLKGLNIPLNRLIFFTDIVQLQKVIVPQQKYGFGKCRTPDNIFMNFISAFKIPKPLIKAKRTIDKIYVSRSQLPFNTGRPLGEIKFEEYLQANGYVVIYPENHTLYEQLEMYKKAKQIIFCDGGAIYATIFLPHLSAAVAIVARRRDSRWNYKELTEHFYGYKKTVLWIDEVVGQYQYGLETWDAAAEINWYKVSITLKEEGFTKTTFEGLYSPAYEEIKKTELQQYIQSIQGNPLFLNYMQKLKEDYPVLPNSF
jgi:capsular polysaccharide biosynthesis protein